MNSILLSYAESETKKITTLVINKSINKNIIDELSIDDLFTIIKDNNDNIKLITYNSSKVTKLLDDVTTNVQKNITKLEKGNMELLNNYFYNSRINGITFTIPLGLVTNSFLLANLGPEIPVKVSLIGFATSKINTKVTEYGLNNALLEVSIYIEVTMNINIPFISKQTKVNTLVPIALKVIQGNVPEYYINGIKGSYEKS